MTIIIIFIKVLLPLARSLMIIGHCFWTYYYIQLFLYMGRKTVGCDTGFGFEKF